jgi:proline dehydrogenase
MENMAVMRSALLWASQNQRLRESLPRYRFVRKAVSRFMPGEDMTAALDAAEALREKDLSAVITQLGENVKQATEAEEVTKHYRAVLDSIQPRKCDCHISVKLTHFGLDLDPELCYSNLRSIVQHAAERENFVWIDMEDSRYVDRTIDLFSQVRSDYSNVGLCVQAYLYRTAEDLQKLKKFPAAIRLVKGCYAEPASVAFQKKSEVDGNYFKLSVQLLEAAAGNKVRVGIATHDQGLIGRILKEMSSRQIPKEVAEIQMLYGIRNADQIRIRKEGVPVRCLISYGSYWFPWYMRRLAERPANVLFVLRNLFEP